MKLAHGLPTVAFAFVLSTAGFAQAPDAAPTPPQAAVQTIAPSSSTADAPYQPPAAPDIRIVRLSLVSGKVQMDHAAGAGYEPAVANLPVIQGAKLRTGDGLAEVEFEDDSTLRLTPNTEIEFSRLDRHDASTASAVKLLHGTVYVDLQKTKGNNFTLTCDDGSADLPPASRVRLTSTFARTEFTVLKGRTVFQRTTGAPVTVSKNKELNLDLVSMSAPVSLVEAEDRPYDEWNQNQEDYHQQNDKGEGYGSPYLYGGNDLNYYGSFASLPGCGNVWRPYFASAAWDPYDAGLWAWYPDAGYSFVSVYPWGWTPFHSGAWLQCSSGAWGWAPYGGWNGLGFAGGGGRLPRRPTPLPIKRHPYPVAPPHPPVPGKTTLLMATQRPLNVSGLNPRTQSFVFRNDSAGLGVPRDMFGKLNKLSAGVQHGGVTAVPMYAQRAPAGSYGAPGRAGAAGRAPITSWRPANSAISARPAGEPARSWSPPANSGGGMSRPSYSPPASSAGASHSSAPSSGGAAHPH